MSKISQDSINRAKTRIHFRNWATKVKRTNMAYQIPEELTITLDPELDEYVNKALDDLGLVFINGYWERK